MYIKINNLSKALPIINILEPEFPYLDALAPFQPLSMKAMHCPIDTSMNFTQANKMIKDLKPAVLILPASYTTPPTGFGHKNEFVIDQVC